VPVEIGKTIWRTLSISGSGGTKNFAQRTIRFMSALKEKGVDFGTLNTHYYPFGEIHEAFDVACKLKADAFKVMLTFGVAEYPHTGRADKPLSLFRAYGERPQKSGGKPPNHLVSDERGRRLAICVRAFVPG
jgi:hypothetical protein